MDPVGPQSRKWAFFESVLNNDQQSQIKLKLHESSSSEEEPSFFDQHIEIPENDHQHLQQGFGTLTLALILKEITERLSKTRIDVPGLSLVVNQKGVSPSYRATVYQVGDPFWWLVLTSLSVIFGFSFSVAPLLVDYTVHEARLLHEI